MKVKDLIVKLQECNPNATVIFSRDEEGNGFMDKCEIAQEEKQVILFPYGYADIDE